MTLEFKTTETATYSFIEFSIPDVLNPQDLEGLIVPKVPGSKGVILSGRGPVWLYGYLVHEYHPTAWVACHDPRLGGAVVVERHSANAPKIGEVVPLPKA